MEDEVPEERAEGYKSAKAGFKRFLIRIIMFFVFMIFTAIFSNIDESKANKNSPNIPKDSYVIVQDGNLRTRPSLESDVVKVLARDTKITANPTEDGKWMELKDGSGFISASLVKKVEPQRMNRFLFWVIIIFAFYLSIKIGSAFCSKVCPYCGHLFGVEKIDSDLLEQYDSTIDEQRTIQHANNRTTRYTVTLPATVNVWKYTYKCVRCNKLWFEIENHKFRK